MSDTPIRRLTALDLNKIIAHFQRLEPQVLGQRFHQGIKPCIARRYAEHIFDRPGHLYGAIEDDALRALAELRPAKGSRFSKSHEAAFTVERSYQSHGLGSALMSRLMIVARNRGIAELHLWCSADNERMICLASKHGAELIPCYGERVAKIPVPAATPASVARELIGEAHAYGHWMRARATKATSAPLPSAT